jgi:hypothetical protein
MELLNKYADIKMEQLIISCYEYSPDCDNAFENLNKCIKKILNKSHDINIIFVDICLKNQMKSKDLIENLINNNFEKNLREHFSKIRENIIDTIHKGIFNIDFFDTLISEYYKLLIDIDVAFGQIRKYIRLKNRQNIFEFLGKWIMYSDLFELKINDSSFSIFLLKNTDMKKIKNVHKIGKILTDYKKFKENIIDFPFKNSIFDGNIILGKFDIRYYAEEIIEKVYNEEKIDREKIREIFIVCKTYGDPNIFLSELYWFLVEKNNYVSTIPNKYNLDSLLNILGSKWTDHQSCNYSLIISLISDICGDKYINNIWRNAYVDFLEKQKFPIKSQVFTNLLTPNDCTFVTRREHLRKNYIDTKKHESVKIDDNVNIYCDIHRKIYEKYIINKIDECSERIFRLNCEESFVFIEYKCLMLKCNIIQGSILLSVQEKGMTGKEISGKINLPLNILDSYLNSLILSEIITRDNKNKNDPMILFSMNEKFKNMGSQVNLIQYLELWYFITVDKDGKRCENKNNGIKSKKNLEKKIELEKVKINNILLENHVIDKDDFENSGLDLSVDIWKLALIEMVKNDDIEFINGRLSAIKKQTIRKDDIDSKIVIESELCDEKSEE